MLSIPFRKSLQNERGASLLMVLVLVVILGLGAGMAGSTWQAIMQRVKEEELLFRGDQYRKAIESYAHSAQGHLGQPLQAGRTTGRFGAAPGGADYPRELQDLLRDPRSPAVRRHLRQLYSDPMTGGAFELIKDPSGRIKGVRSASLQEPFKTGNFAPEYENFRDAQTYRDWEFIYEPGKAISSNSTGGTTIQGLPAGSVQASPPQP